MLHFFHLAHVGWITVQSRGMSHLEIRQNVAVYGSRQCAIEDRDCTSCPLLVEMPSQEDCSRIKFRTERIWACGRFFSAVTLKVRCHGWKRTKFRDSDGDRVIVGFFVERGLGVDDNWDDIRNSIVGLASARK